LLVLASNFCLLGICMFRIFLQYALASIVCSGISVFWCKFLKFKFLFQLVAFIRPLWSVAFVESVGIDSIFHI